jgi:hypothetical protein
VNLRRFFKTRHAAYSFHWTESENTLLNYTNFHWIALSRPHYIAIQTCLIRWNARWDDEVKVHVGPSEHLFLWRNGVTEHSFQMYKVPMHSIVSTALHSDSNLANEWNSQQDIESREPILQNTSCSLFLWPNWTCVHFLRYMKAPSHRIVSTTLHSDSNLANEWNSQWDVEVKVHVGPSEHVLQLIP